MVTSTRLIISCSLPRHVTTTNSLSVSQRARPTNNQNTSESSKSAQRYIESLLRETEFVYSFSMLTTHYVTQNEFLRKELPNYLWSSWPLDRAREDSRSYWFEVGGQLFTLQASFEQAFESFNLYHSFTLLLNKFLLYTRQRSTRRSAAVVGGLASNALNAKYVAWQIT